MDVKIVTCPQCGHVNPATEKCVRCGTDLTSVSQNLVSTTRLQTSTLDSEEGVGPTQISRCPKCGMEDPGEEKCPRCGIIFAKYFEIQAREMREAQERAEAARRQKLERDRQEAILKVREAQARLDEVSGLVQEQEKALAEQEALKEAMEKEIADLRALKEKEARELEELKASREREEQKALQENGRKIQEVREQLKGLEERLQEAQKTLQGVEAKRADEQEALETIRKSREEDERLQAMKRDELEAEHRGILERIREDQEKLENTRARLEEEEALWSKKQEEWKKKEEEALRSIEAQERQLDEALEKVKEQEERLAALKASIEEAEQAEAARKAREEEKRKRLFADREEILRAIEPRPSLKEQLKKYEGRTMGINAADPETVEEVLMLQVGEDHFIVWNAREKLAYNFPVENIQTLIEGPGEHQPEDSESGPTYEAVLKIFHARR
ncbi:MAG: hypothetical protein JRF59_00955 [Deltaproteobacteria bacterium]|nr:hypothetical protein [Deltaproteobacteria bacterium]MBW2346396.1 hypothetical protein [Deltaproteobacteria bacterium]